MSKPLFLRPHPENPQAHLLAQAVDGLNKGEIWILPTDSTYVLACLLDNKEAVTKMRQIRGLDAKHFFTVACPHLSKLSELAKVDNAQYRLLKMALPGPWTFILSATSEIPKRLAHPSRKTIGLRVPDNTVLQSILTELENPLVITTAQANGFDEPAHDEYDLEQQFSHTVKGIVSVGQLVQIPTTIIDLTVTPYQLIRMGQLSPENLGLNIE